MAKTKQTIYKNRKYGFQFPEGTSTDDQKKYLNAVKSAWEKDDIVVIDPKVKVYPKDYAEEIEVDTPEEEVKTEEVTETPAEGTPVEEPVKETPTEAPAEEEVTVTKVETTPAPEQVAAANNVLMGEEE